MTMDRREEIAIIGMGCRFPGNAGTPEAFWTLLRNGVDAITDIPPDRPQLAQVYDPDPRKPGRSYLRRGGFIRDVDRWDAAFFGISPREALHIDPQHRLLLEVTWEALEDAGQSVEGLAGSRTGVFVGISTHDYGDMQCDPTNRALLDAHSNSGSATSIAANRISYLYDLRGPSLTVDTACSSSLTAAHLACMSLLSGECEVAVVGGVQLQLNPELTIGFCKAAMISPTGECRAFDASANGYVRSEGAGAVVLKPLRRALADGDRVYAVIAGSAINQDGRTTGMTVPNPVAQEALVREALASAGLSAADVHYVEAHGTGTPVGDPLEAQALGAVLRDGRAEGDPCPIGSVKSNIGHLEAASGVAGLIKAALTVHHREIPPSLHFEAPNPATDFERDRLRVVTTLEQWPRAAGRATVGVNSFGFGGANAHVIVREAPPTPTATPANAAPARVEPAAATIIPISARSPEALAALARGYMTMLAAADGPDLADAASTAAHRRAHHEHRLTVVAASRDDAVDALDAALAGESRATLATGRRSDGGGKLAFVFSGMGPQWWGMGRQLAATNHVFRHMLERCHDVLAPHAPWGLLDELARDEATSRVSEPDLAQVTNFAIQVALAEVWKSWGIVPDAVVGHSAGEMAAAYCAGALTLEEAVKVAYHRSRLQSEALPGKILAVGMSPDALAPILADYNGEIDLAAVNSPVSCTVAGSAAAIEALLARLQSRQTFARMLSFAVAYHSSRMDPIRDALTGVLSDVRPCDGTIPMVSTVSGTWMTGASFGAPYWFENVRRTVRFADGISTLLDSGHRTFVEISPHPVLAGSVSECLAARNATATVLPSLRRKEDERACMLRALGPLYVQGRAIDWDGVLEGRRSNVPLPAYPWQRERHWLETTPVHEAAGERRSENSLSEHPLLGRRVRAAQPIWESSLGGERLAFLDDHVIQGTVVFPGAAYVEMALNAVRAVLPNGEESAVRIRRVAFRRALFLPARARSLVQISLDAAATRFEVHGSTSPNGEPAWTLHADGEVGIAPAGAPAVIDLAEIRARCAAEVSHADCYAALARRGLEYGPAFRGISKLWTGVGEAIGFIRVPDETIAPAANGDDYQLHPAVLDAALQLLFSAGGGTPDAGAPGSTPSSTDGLFLPVALRDLTLHAPAGRAFWAHARLVSFDAEAIEGDVRLFDEAGRVIATVRGLRCQRIAEARARDTIDDWMYEFRWEPRAAGGAAERSSLDVSPRSMATGLAAAADRLSAERRWPDYYVHVEARLDELALAFMLRAIRELAGEQRAEESFTPATLGVDPAHGALAGHVLGALAAAGHVRRAGDAWTSAWDLAPVAAGRDARSMADAIAAEYPAYENDVALIARCGDQLAGVLAGRVDAASVLFGGNAFALLARFYREAPPSRYYNMLVADAVRASVAGAAPDGPVRVLEIGGGTGGTTGFVLPMLDGARTEYVFTDVTPLFAEQAKQRFADTGFVSARTFDVERDPAAQGIAAESFDVVIAANVLHATASVAGALENARRLLAPGGVLVLLEITRGPLWIDLIFGLTAGWWRFADRDLRPSHPLMSAGRWQALLERSGFDDVAPIRDSAHMGEAAQTVLLARAGAPGNGAGDAPPAGARDAGAWVIFADDCGTGMALHERLAGAGVRTIVVEHGTAFRRCGDGRFMLPAGDEAAAASLFRVLDDDGVRPHGIVFCWPLDAGDPTADGDRVLETQHTGLRGALSVVQALAKRDGGVALPELWLVTAGAQPMGAAGEELSLMQAPVWGLGRVITKEQPALRTRLIDLGREPSTDEVAQLAREVLAGEWEDELALRGTTRFVRRLHRLPLASIPEPRRAAAPGGAWRAEIDTPGALETLTLRRAARRVPSRGEVEIAVSAASINFRDVMLAMGLQPSIANEASFGRGLLGLDCAGVVTACGEGVTDLVPGDEVAGIGAGTFGSYVTTPALLVTRRPPGLTAVQAAAIPSVFVTAHYSLRHLARLARDERVLIHSATGGVGLAALQVARDAGAEIFATAGSAEKRRYLASLGIEHVMDSRSTRFADEILERTNGEGVDVVLNSLAGDAIGAGIGALRAYGRFVEIGKRDIYADSKIGLLAFRKNLSFFGVDVDLLSLQRPELAHDMLRAVVDGFARGVFTAPPCQEFPITRLEEAMRFVAQARHIGKVVLRTDDAVAEVAPGRDTPLFREDASYLITGGLGGFGLALAAWMRRQGAHHVALMGRSGAAGDRVRALREAGMHVEVVRGDVAHGDDVRRVLDEIRRTMPPLRGVVHAAMVLDDVAITQLDGERLDRVMAPKMTGAWHLHQETLNDPIDCFVMLSSLTSTFGNPLQANYAAANAFLDALAHHRRALGRPALAVNWGPLSGVGYVSRHRDVADYLARQGYLAFTPDQAFDVLGTLLRREATHVTAAKIDWARWAESSPTAAASAMLRQFAPTAGPGTAGGSNESAAGTARTEVLRLPAGERRTHVVSFLRDSVSRVFGISASKLDVERSLTDLGLDSLMAVELMTTLHVHLGVELAAVKLLQGVSISGLASLVLEHLGGAPEVADPGAPGDNGMRAPMVEAAMVAVPVVEAPAGTTLEGPTAVPVRSVAPTMTAAPERPAGATPSRYSTLDYSRWTIGQRAIRRAVATGLLAVAKLDVEGVENLPRTGGCLLAINHLSMADVPVLLSVLPRRTIMFASDHLRGSAFMNWFLSDMGDAIYVRRGEGDTEALASGLAVLRAGGLLGLGPEGTRSRDGGLARGRTGVAYLAAQAGVPVVPLAAWGHERMPAHWRTLRRAPVAVRIGAPLLFSDRVPDAARLREYTDQVMRAIAAMLPARYRGVYGEPAVGV